MTKETIRRELPRLLLLGMALACIALLAGCTTVVEVAPGTTELEDGGAVARVAPDRWAQCKQEGGCSLVTAKQAAEALQTAYIRGTFDGARSCPRN